ncbi:MAG: Cas10/Cmr2 second palm domain-containing protein [Promethearchaeota archaeon]
MKKINAILMEIGSIQDYIFSSNRLKHVIGASYIVKKIFEEDLKDVLKEIFGNGDNNNLNKWKEKPNKIKIINGTTPFEIGYIGGGNALLFIKERENVKKFIQLFTKTVLRKYPGVRIFFGISYEFDISNFKNSMNEIHKNLKKNKNSYFPIITLPKHGFTAECPESAECTEIDFKNDDGKFISGVVKAKILAAEEAMNTLKRDFENELEDTFDFTNELDYLGISGGDNYIAIVCIDGNEIGKRFNDCNSLEEFRLLSKTIQDATQKSFGKMLKNLIESIKEKKISKNNNFKFIKQNEGKYLIPLVPVIIGGDDITFVSNGRLAIYLAEKFIENFTEQLVSDKKKLSACAGISIVKTKYPFFKAYSLAKDLLRSAKKRSREDKNSSYLDFFISSGGFSGSYEEILINHFTAIEGILHYGPYKFEQSKILNNKCIENLKRIVDQFKKWPKNKLMEFRELLFDEKDKVIRFIKKLEIKGINLPKIEGKNFHIEIWENKETPYFDAIEILNFYPKELL